MRSMPGDTDAMHPRMLGAVAAGGAIGALARWGVAEAVGTVSDTSPPDAFPWSTLAVNVLGSLCIAIAAMRLVSGTRAWAFVVTGVLGGFTTMSALAVELNDLAEADRTDTAVLYVVATFGAAALTFLAAERLATPAGKDAPS